MYSSFDHSEAFLQWIWENMLFDYSGLQTACGKALTIFNPGQLNTSDGPDFKHAVLEIDGIIWHGDVELHTKTRNWKLHGHHTDENYNSVVLHVIADHDCSPVSCENQNTPFTLNLLPCLSDELGIFLKNFNDPKQLPCSSGLRFISEPAFQQQIEKAHKEYFEKKTHDFLRFYNSHLPLSHAWKQALILSLWDGLGISHNRESMQMVASKLLEDMPISPQESLKRALEISGFSSTPSNITWNVKAVRPANHPSTRIKQSVELTHLILQHPFKKFLRASENFKDLWEQWLEACALKNTSRFQILYGTVFLPAFYVLGNLLVHSKLSEAAFYEWKLLKTPLPKSLLTEFASLNVEASGYRKKLGAVHQIKSYCKAGRCSECLVLKKAIVS